MIANPVLHKELFMRMRLRQVSSPAKIGVVLLVLGALSAFYYLTGKSILDSPTTSAGHNAWLWCIGIQFTVICLIAPVIAANCITQEKEQQTWEMLISTQLKPAEIILGKLAARLAIILVLFALFFPMTAFSWANAIVSETQVSVSSRIAEFVLSYAVLGISALFFATFGLYMSWQVRKTLTAIILSYTFAIGFLLVGTFIVYFALQFRFTDSTFLVKCPVLWINPVYLMVYATSPDRAENSTLFVVYGLLVYIVGTLALLWRMVLGFYHFSYDDDGAPAVGPNLRAMVGRLSKQRGTAPDPGAAPANAATSGRDASAEATID